MAHTLRTITIGSLALLAGLRMPASAQKQPSGPQVLTIYSDVDDSEQPYGLYLPKNFDEHRKYPLVVMLHGALSNHRLELKRVFGKSNLPGENDLEASRYFPKWDDVEMNVVEEMVSASWRARRATGMQTILFNTEFANVEPPGSDGQDLLDSVNKLADSPAVRLLHRYETHYHRVYHRCIATLLKLQRSRPAAEPAVPNEPKPVVPNEPEPVLATPDPIGVHQHRYELTQAQPLQFSRRLSADVGIFVGECAAKMLLRTCLIAL
jgi:hypothetical protein